MGSIKDRVAIVGMGCTKFGERWDKGTEDLAIEAAYEAYEDAGIAKEEYRGLLSTPRSWPRSSASRGAVAADSLKLEQHSDYPKRELVYIRSYRPDRGLPGRGQRRL